VGRRGKGSPKIIAIRPSKVIYLEGIPICINAKAECQAYKFEPKIIHTKRYGNVFLDLFNFKRKSQESGWQFSALIVLIDDTVVYKLWSGNPLINEDLETRNPLGPLQNPGDSVKGAVPLVH
jgi:hypothetical protein